MQKTKPKVSVIGTEVPLCRLQLLTKVYFRVPYHEGTTYSQTKRTNAKIKGLITVSQG